MSLTSEIEEKMVRAATKELAKHLITQHGNKVYLTVYEAGGILNWSPATVKAHLPIYDSTGNGGSDRVLLSDIEEELKKRRREKAKTE